MDQAHPAASLQPANQAKRMQNPKATRQEHGQAGGPAATKAEPGTTASAAEPRTDENNADARGMHRGNKMNREQNASTEAVSSKKSSHPGAPNATGERSAPNPATSKQANGRAKKPDPKVVQQVKAQNANFKAQPKPGKVPTVTFNKSYRINGAEHWQGPQYEVFRSYHPVWHDQNWYRSRYNRVEIIAGGAYYFLNGFWFPAWGYSPAYQYYAYDAPIYVGSRAEPPDRVIADVQAILQQEGYYKGEVDGLLGPLTREALIGYQTDNGLYATATIDEPTLASLDLG